MSTNDNDKWQWQITLFHKFKQYNLHKSHDPNGVYCEYDSNAMNKLYYIHFIVIMVKRVKEQKKNNNNR